MTRVTIALVATFLGLTGCDDSDRSRARSGADAGALSSQQATTEVINQLKLWIKVFSGEKYSPNEESFSGRIDLDGEDVLISDASAGGTLTYAYPVPVRSSIIVVTSAGGMVIRLGPRSIPARLAPARPSIERAIHELNRTPGLQRAPDEALGSWYARILKILVASMERADRSSGKGDKPYRSHLPRSAFHDHGIEVPIPGGWQPPAAQIGAGIPRFRDGARTVSPTVHEVYLSPDHGDSWGEIELVLFEIDARSWLNAMVIQPENWLPVQGDELLSYSTPDQDNIVGALLPFGNVSAVKFRISRRLPGLAGREIRFLENLYYCSCGDRLLRVQMRSASEYFPRLEASVFARFIQEFRCPRPR